MFRSAENKPIEGIIKHRYSDFIVQEIREDGSTVEFTPLPPPSAAEEKPAAPEVIHISKQQYAELATLLGEETSNQFRDYIDEINAGTRPRGSLFKTPFNVEEKEHRRQVHHFFKKTLMLFETHVAEVDLEAAETPSAEKQESGEAAQT